MHERYDPAGALGRTKLGDASSAQRAAPKQDTSAAPSAGHQLSWLGEKLYSLLLADTVRASCCCVLDRLVSYWIEGLHP